MEGADPHHAGWQPVTEERTDVITEAAAARLHGLLDAPGIPPRTGDPAPALWHWLAFLPGAPQRDLKADGHPAHGSLLPPVDLPRRMYAGGQLTWHAPLPVGVPLRRTSAVVAVRPKVGRSGRLVFVTVEHRVSTPTRSELLVERTDLVFREPPGPNRAAPAAPAAPSARDGTADAGSWPWAGDLPIEPTLLFRFSALTYNAHRIHYDRPYATGVEGYPGLVVHGPLQAVALAELCRRHDPRPLAAFRFTALAPAFDDGPLRLRGRPGGTEVAVLRAFDVHGTAVMEATATFATDTR